MLVQAGGGMCISKLTVSTSAEGKEARAKRSTEMCQVELAGILLERQNREKGREGAGLQMHAGAAAKTRHPCVAAQSTFLLWPQRRERARRWPRELLPRPALPCGQAFVWGSRLQGALATTTPGRVRPAGSQGNEGRQV